MNNLLTHYPVNWIDGMKLSSSHFTAVQDFVTDSVRDAIALQTIDLNYGLQPVVGDSVKMQVLMDHYNQLQLTLEECHAVTPNGIRIQISASQEGQTLTLSKDMTEMKGNATFSVFITAELFKPTPYGEAAAQEYPPRIPFLRPTYSLYLYTDEELKNKDLGDGYLMIGRVIMDNGQVRLDDTYIPPCSCVIAHPSLQNLYHRIRSFYAKMENYAIQISQKIHIKKQNNELSTMIDKINERMLVFLGQEINRFELLSPYNPPCELLLSVTAFARIVKNFTDAHSGAGKEELLNYFSEWCNLTQGAFEQVFNTLINTHYNHNHIRKHIKVAEEFMDLIEDLYNNLSRLDYIGKKPDGGIFVAETTNENQDIVRRTRSLLVD